MNNFFTKSDKFKQEYCCSVVKIGELTPVENSDNLVKTNVLGRTIIVNKNNIKTGDVMFYADNETELNINFLSKNNQFRKAELNVDPSAPTGFFEDNGRVRMIRLRGSYSMGYVFDLNAMVNFCPSLKGINLNDYVGEAFDTVCGTPFIKMYIPKVSRTSGAPGSKADKKSKRAVEKFDKMIDGEFFFHYDTTPFYKVLSRFSPEQEVTISRKIHGTSAIFAKVKVNKPHEYNTGIGFVDKLLNKYVPFKWRKTDVMYDNIYSSRNVIKNQYVNKESGPGYYKSDVWGDYNKLIGKYIPDGMTLYGEIVGYCTGENKMLQKDYDYGCKTGENKLMIYRITYSKNDGSKVEMDVEDVCLWVAEFLGEHPELKSYIMPLPVVFKGTFNDIVNYDPREMTIDVWRDKLLEAMKKRKDWYMEENEPLCHNKVPAEGVVIRINNDPLKEAFKLKCDKFFAREAKMIDNGEVDMEMESTM